MCVLALAWQAHPRWRLVVAGNRDELHARPAAPLARWETPADVLAGRDLEAGGTWMGVSAQGRFAVVTNMRGFGPPLPGHASRGALVTDLLAGEGDFADPAHVDLARFNPFSLMFIDQGRAQFLANRPDATRSTLGPGVYGLSNGALDAPWPKTLQLKGALLDWIVADAGAPEGLFDALALDALPDFGMAPAAPSEVPQEAPLSPIFIRNPVYGTRCSTVVAIDRDGHGQIIERRFDAAGTATGETALRFNWPD